MGAAPSVSFKTACNVKSQTTTLQGSNDAGLAHLATEWSRANRALHAQEERDAQWLRAASVPLPKACEEFG